MPRGKKFTAEQIIGKLREAEVGLAQGKTVPEVAWKLGLTEQTFYRWKREHRGLRTDQAKRRQAVEHVRAHARPEPGAMAIAGYEHDGDQLKSRSQSRPLSDPPLSKSSVRKGAAGSPSPFTRWESRGASAQA